MKLGWLESLVAWNLCPELVGSMLEGMISNRLGGTVFREKLKRSGPDFLSIVKAIVCGSCFGIVHVGSIFIGHGFRKFLINQTGISRFSCGLASHAYFRPLIK